METTIQVPLLTRGAEVRASSFDAKDNTVDIVWTTGAAVRRMSWRDGPYDEELVVTPDAVRLDRLNAGAAFLDTHSSYGLDSVLGCIVPGSARIEKGQGLATVKLSGAAGVADSVQKIAEGTVRNISAGYAYHRVDKIERSDNVPLWRAVDWEPLEISAVPIPADPGAQFRSGSVDGALRFFPCAFRDSGILAARNARARMQMRTAAARLL